LPVLRERVFHVTAASNLEAIIASGSLLANPPDGSTGHFGTYRKSYGRTHNKVSFFDYRELTEETLEESFTKCCPWSGLHACDHRIAILFLASLEWHALERWTREAMIATGWLQAVPWVESWHASPVPLNHIEEIFLVAVTEPTDPFLQALLKRSRPS
jgi:hypothetical protein